jgi:putative peptidoglycan binding protein
MAPVARGEMDAPRTNPGRWGRLSTSARAPRTRLAALAAATAAAAAILTGVAIAVSAGGGTASAADGGTGASYGPHAGARAASPYRDDGMWIWYVSRSSGGDLSRIAHKAHRRGIETVYIKSSDGSSSWSQFTRGLVSYLQARHLRVCAWQFVYGVHPGAEARRGAGAVRKGADCLVIDAESSYEGRYAAADIYVDKLRHKIGSRFPTALTGFPYVDYHPGFPYSVFLGPGGAHYNLPQLYWHTIGVSVATGYEHTFRFNRVYRRAIYPLGQTYDNPPARQVRRFRRMAISYGLDGVSWWSWQETNKREWRALGRDIDRGVAGVHRSGRAYPALSKGSRGDLVVWAQEHLRGAGQSVPVTGYFGRRTRRAVKRFQRSKGFADDGHIGATTWHALLAVAPRTVDWSSKRPRRLTKRSGTGGEPRSASLPALRDEIPPPAER